MNFSDIKVFTSNGWETVKQGEATWGIKGITDGYGKSYGGIEWTIPNPNTFPSLKKISTATQISKYLGSKPTINPYAPLTNYFQSNI